MKEVKTCIYLKLNLFLRSLHLFTILSLVLGGKIQNQPIRVHHRPRWVTRPEPKISRDFIKWEGGLFRAQIFAREVWW